MKHVFIVNPVAGNGKYLETVKKIEDACAEEKLDYVIHYTKGPKDATEIALSYKNDHVIIFGVGGDGTLSEVINGIVETKNILGIIPCGSGNDFYKCLDDVDQLYKTIDLGRINGKYFINIVSVGIDSEVGHNANIFRKKFIPRKQIYNLSVLYTLFLYKSKKLKFEFNLKEQEGNFTIVTVCNGRYYGGGYNIAPTAKIDDHLFDVYFVKKMSKFKMPSAIMKMKKGDHENEVYVTKEQTDMIRIRGEHKLICNVDGETLIDDNFYIELVKDALTIYNNKKLINKILK